jgi:alcohol dehydrogenase (NADP+)
MTTTTKGYAALSPDADLRPFVFPRRAPRADDVLIDVLYCGVCHSDLHQVRNDWGYTSYPVVPGHEVVGRVKSVGSGVRAFRAGDLVGVGCYVDSCQHCKPCVIGEEQYCLNYPTPTYGGVDRHDGSPTYGGYSENIVVSEKFVVRIPDGMDPAAAAPLLCAGITTYSPFRHWNIGAGHQVGVVGLGGLGHMALKFAKAMGAEVTLFTRSPGKEQEAIRLGADHVVLSTDDEQMKAVTNKFDFILDTVPNAHDINPYILSLGFEGTLILLGLLAPVEPPFNNALLMLGRKSVTSSNVGGIRETQEMLDFCADQGIASDVEVIDIQQINAAFERMLKGDVRYRFVIDIKSLQEA